MVPQTLLETLQNSFIGQDTEYPTIEGRRSPRIYLDSAASTLMLQPAYDIGQEFLRHYASTHSDLHYSARGANRAFRWAHDRVLAFVDASPEEYSAFFVGSGATAGFNRLATSLSQSRPERPVVLASEMEHHSNDLPHRHHSERLLHIPSLGENHRYGGIDLAALRALINAHGTQINYIAVTGASNVTGTITPLAEIAELAHAVGAYLLVDASQMIAHAPVSMNQANIDMLVFSGHKIYAPGSPGAVITRTELLNSIAPAELGGGMVDEVNIAEYTSTKTLPDREEAGTPNIVGAVMLGAVLELLGKVGMQAVRAKEIAQVDYLWHALSSIEGVQLYGPEPAPLPRTGTITFNIHGLDHGLTAAALNDYYNIQVRNGCFCAHPYVRDLMRLEMWELDIDPESPAALPIIERKRGMARASFGLHTQQADLEALVSAVRELAEQRDTLVNLYEPIGKNGYRHRTFTPPARDLFDPGRSLDEWLNNKAIEV